MQGVKPILQYHSVSRSPLRVCRRLSIGQSCSVSHHRELSLSFLISCGCPEVISGTLRERITYLVILELPVGLGALRFDDQLDALTMMVQAHVDVINQDAAKVFP
jgi:hypothetical protein